MMMDLVKTKTFWVGGLAVAYGVWMIAFEGAEWARMLDTIVPGGVAVTLRHALLKMAAR